MSNFVVTTGELQRKASQYNTIPQLKFEDKSIEVEVITLMQAERDMANELAWLDINVHSIPAVEAKIEQIISDKVFRFQEFIMVEKDKIIVGVDRDVVDDSAVNRAIMMLIEIDSFKIESYKVFGETNEHNK